MATQVFTTLVDAIHAGYQVKVRTQKGYQVRTKVGRNWVEAEVQLGGVNARPDTNPAPSGTSELV